MLKKSFLHDHSFVDDEDSLHMFTPKAVQPFVEKFASELSTVVYD